METAKRSKLLLIVISAGAFYALLFTLDIARAAIVCVAALLSVVFILKSGSCELRFQKKYVLLELAILMLSASSFFEYWRNARKVQVIAAKLSLQSIRYNKLRKFKNR